MKEVTLRSLPVSHDFSYENDGEPTHKKVTVCNQTANQCYVMHLVSGHMFWADSDKYVYMDVVSEDALALQKEVKELKEALALVRESLFQSQSDGMDALREKDYLEGELNKVMDYTQASFEKYSYEMKLSPETKVNVGDVINHKVKSMVPCTVALDEMVYKATTAVDASFPLQGKFLFHLAKLLRGMLLDHANLGKENKID